MRDIVDRLRAAQRVGTYDGTGRAKAANLLCTDLMEAADEIMRLREALRALHDEQVGPQLPGREKQWQEAMRLSGEALRQADD